MACGTVTWSSVSGGEGTGASFHREAEGAVMLSLEIRRLGETLMMAFKT